MTSVPASPTHVPMATLAIVGSLFSQNLVAAFAKTLFPLVGVEGMVALRVGISALLLAAMWRPWRNAAAAWRHRVNLLAYGLSLGVMNLLIYKAFALIPIGIGVAIEVAGPLFVVLISSRKPLDFVWLALAVLGLSLLLPLHQANRGLDWRGLAYAGGAGLCWALYILSGKRISGILAGGQAVAIGMAVSAACMVPLGLHTAGAALLEPSTLALGAVIALFSSTLPYSLEMMALRFLPRFVFGILVSTAPAVAAFSGFVVLGERLTGPQWLAIACMVAASAGSAAIAARPARA
ncbi:EamA family transporter [Oleispirillum naphthae]|uniref:EamA family transporter n=1 Tax=Oleispirillum naphthae TaxID=2838853 RepID=UPI00308244E3